MAKAPKKKLSKKDAVLDVIKRGKVTGNKDIPAEVKKLHGITVTVSYVANIKSTTKKKAKGTGKRGRKPGSKNRPTEAGNSRINVIEAVANLVEATGSIQGAKDAIAAIERIGSVSRIPF